MDPRPPLLSVEDLTSTAVLVRLRGEHDLTTAPELRRTLILVRSTIVDPTEASFIDSSIVGALITAGSEIALIIVSPPGSQPRRVLDMVRAGDLVPVVDDRTAALGMYGLGDSQSTA